MEDGRECEVLKELQSADDGDSNYTGCAEQRSEALALGFIIVIMNAEKLRAGVAGAEAILVRTTFGMVRIISQPIALLVAQIPPPGLEVQ